MFTLDGFGYIDATNYARRAPLVFVFVFEDGSDHPYFYIGSTNQGTPCLKNTLIGVRKINPRNQDEMTAKGKVPKTYIIPAMSSLGAINLKQELLDKYASDEKCLNFSDVERGERAAATKVKTQPNKKEVKAVVALTPDELKQRNRQYSEALFKRPKTTKPVLVSGHWYSSITCAANNLCCSNRLVVKRIASSEFPDWKYAEPKKQYR